MNENEVVAVRIANAVLVAAIGLSIFLTCAGVAVLVPALRKLGLL